MPLDVPLEHLGQGPRLGRQVLDRRQPRRPRLGQNLLGAGGTGRQHGREQVLRRVRLAQQAFRQAHPEGALEAQQEFRPAQAVEPQVPLQVAVQPDPQPAPRVQLEGEITDDREQPFACRGRRPAGLGRCPVLRRRLVSLCSGRNHVIAKPVAAFAPGRATTSV